MRFHQPPAIYAGSLQLKTTDLARSVHFYRDVVGFQILEQGSNGAKLSADRKTPILSLIQPVDVMPRPSETTGLYHFALLLPDRSALARFVTHLANQGIRFGASHHLVSEAIYFSDPDGNGIEVYADTVPATWDWRESGVAMDTIPLDFDDLLQAAGPDKQVWKGLPQSTILGHIHLQVSHLPVAEAFYTAGLGFEVVARYRGSALFLSSAKYHHHIALNTWNGVGAPRPPKNSAGLDYFTIVFPDGQRLEEAAGRLGTLGAPVTKEGSQFMTEDPAGNAILLTAGG